MERYYTQTIGADIFTETGLRVGRVAEVIVNPDSGKIVGFLLFPQGQKAIAPNDVLFWNRQLVISDSEDILDTEDLIKVQEVLQRKIPILKNKVISKSGEHLGQVLDFAIDPKFFTLSKILVSKTFLGLIPYDEKIFIAKDILEIRSDAIVVKDPLRHTPIKEKKQPEKVRGKLRIDVAPQTYEGTPPTSP